MTRLVRANDLGLKRDWPSQPLRHQRRLVTNQRKQASKRRRSILDASLIDPPQLSRSGANVTGDERQIHVFQQLLEHLEVRYFALISSFETLRPLWKNKHLKQHLFPHPKICRTSVA